MNRYLFSLLTAAIVAVPAAHAQTSTKPMAMDPGTAMHREHGDSGEHAKMMAQLNLTDAQKTQIKAIHEKYEAQMKGAHEAGQSNMAGMAGKPGMGKAGMGKMAGMDKMMSQGMAEVRAVLTPDQQKQFDTMVAEHKKQHEAMDHGKMDDGKKKMPMGSMPGMSK